MKAAIAVSLLMCSGLSVAKEEVVRFATTATYPPFEWVNEHNEIVGYEIDLTNALCEAAKVKCTFTNQIWDSVIPSLKFRRYDASVSGLDITPERLKQVEFTKPYFKNTAILLVRSDSTVQNFADLKGKKVGMENGVTHQRYINDKFPEVTTVAYASWNDSLLDLKNGRLDAIFADTAVVQEWLKTNPTLKTAGEKVTDPDYFGIGYGMMFRKGNIALLERFNKAIDEITANGKLKTINDKWFPNGV
ncbi:transporter substrate-binding domain-containing protein [Ewingella americana]|uniref:transporter substrate-binding domain-containing protein n=1 Tax=Ewingella americana TaxID=41202 RepID=UPI003D67FEA7